MFSAAVNHLVKEFGRDTLTPTPSLNKADDIQLFNLVIKHKKHFFWQSKCQLEPLSLPLSAVLKQSVGDTQIPLVAFNSLARKRDLGQYSFQLSTNMKGKLAVELLRDDIADLNSGDTIKCDANFSKLEKLYVSEYELGEALENQYLDLENDIIKKLRKKSHQVLCMVSGVIHPVENVTLVRQSTFTEGGKIKADVKKEIADIDVEENVDKDDNYKVEIPAKTNLAYHVVELKIRPDGSIGVCLIDEDKGGFDIPDSLPVKEKDKSLFYPPEEVASVKDKREVQEAFAECLNFPILMERLVHILHVIHSHEEEKEPWDDRFWRFVGDDGFQATHRFLKLINVNFEYGEAIEACNVDKDMLGCVLYYLELMSFMSDEEINAIKYCAFRPHLVPCFLKVFRDTLTEKPIEKNSMMPLLEYDQALDFLYCLGYDLSNVEKTDTVLPPKESFKAVEAAGKILYGLFILPVQ